MGYCQLLNPRLSAIAIKNSLSEDKKQVELTAVIGSKKSFNGKVIAALVEDGSI